MFQRNGQMPLAPGDRVEADVRDDLQPRRPRAATRPHVDGLAVRSHLHGHPAEADPPRRPDHGRQHHRLADAHQDQGRVRRARGRRPHEQPVRLSRLPLLPGQLHQRRPRAPDRPAPDAGAGRPARSTSRSRATARRHSRTAPRSTSSTSSPTSRCRARRSTRRRASTTTRRRI